jgi:hypothetical protein
MAERSSPGDLGCGLENGCHPQADALIRAQPAHFARFTMPSPSLYTVALPPLRRAV